VNVEAVHGTAAVRLVAAREIRVRMRARSFRVALGISVAAVVLGIVVPHLLASTPDPYDIGLVGALAGPSADAMRSAGDAVDRKIIVHQVSSERAARAALRAGSLDMAVVDAGTRLIVQRVPRASDTGTFARYLATVRGTLGLYDGLFAGGLTPDAARAALSHPPLPVTGVLAPRRDRDAQKAITSVGIILVFIFIQQYGSWVLTGVVEEKASRVVEVLLAVVSPGELLVGKTLGIGVVAMAHGATVAVAGLAASAAIGGTVLEHGGWQLMISLVGWFLLAYALYCLLMAMAGSLVARQEEAQNASFPFTLPLLIGYVASIGTVFSDTTPTFVKVLSFIPLTAPVSMPARLAAGNVPVVQVAISVGLLLVSIVVAARMASIVYERGVLQTRRLKWSDVLHRIST
jgi:ABC-2 type transport system permease protein